MTDCLFDQETTVCVEHGGLWDGWSPTCKAKPAADKLEAKIAKLQARRDAMRPTPEALAGFARQLPRHLRGGAR